VTSTSRVWWSSVRIPSTPVCRAEIG